MAQAQWTSVEKAKAYIAVCEKSKVKGLKYCSAVDFVANYGKERCTRCGKYHYPDELVTKDAEGNNISLCNFNLYGIDLCLIMLYNRMEV